MPNEKATWFCKIDGSVRGSLSAKELRDLARSGKLKPNDPVRRGDRDKWVRADRVKGLFEIAGVNTPQQNASIVKATDGKSEEIHTAVIVPEHEASANSRQQSLDRTHGQREAERAGLFTAEVVTDRKPIPRVTASNGPSADGEIELRKKGAKVIVSSGNVVIATGYETGGTIALTKQAVNGQQCKWVTVKLGQKAAIQNAQGGQVGEIRSLYDVSSLEVTLDGQRLAKRKMQVRGNALLALVLGIPALGVFGLAFYLDLPLPLKALAIAPFFALYRIILRVFDSVVNQGGVKPLSFVEQSTLRKVADLRRKKSEQVLYVLKTDSNDSRFLWIVLLSVLHVYELPESKYLLGACEYKLQSWKDGTE